jgi:hypothetical protein
MPLRLSQRSKYGSVRTTVDGMTFDSKKEARRYGELKLLLKAGQIRNLKIQPHFALMAPVLSGAVDNVNAGKFERVSPLGEYRADFSFDERTGVPHGWRFVVEDVKSPATRKKQLYVWKKRHFERQYGIAIREV